MYPILVNTDKYSISLIRERIIEKKSLKFKLKKLNKKLGKIFAAPPSFELKAPWAC